MAAWLLVVIYLGFMGLGLPDPLLGAAWPMMHTDLSVPLANMGILSMMIAMGTILSSLFTGYLTRKVGTGWLTFGSVLLTAVALFGFSQSDAFWQLCLWTIPYGLGAGAVDAALNHYVSVHYAAKHLNWLHCFWGVGTMLSPYLMGALLSIGKDWQSGYFAVAMLQFGIAAVVACSLPCWAKPRIPQSASTDRAKQRKAGLRTLFAMKGVPPMLLLFFCYCALETTAGLWASTYMNQSRGIVEERAALFASLFYMGITLGRFLSGVVTARLGDRNLVRVGLCAMLVGVGLLLLPIRANGCVLVGLFVIGFGCAPIYPALLHESPALFGDEQSLSLIGFQMASAYLGVNIIPTVFGYVAEATTLRLFPYVLLLFAVLLFGLNVWLHRAVSHKSAIENGF